jgi:thiamine biosynthesis lipoprotein
MSEPAYEIADWSTPAMGGRLAVAVAAEPTAIGPAARAAERVGRRVNAWANRLTRFDEDSDLCRLNADGGAVSHVRPTLGAALGWAHDACAWSEGIVSVTMLDERLAAEAVEAPLSPTSPPDSRSGWSARPAGRRVEVRRPSGLRFDLDGVAKGWLADRACWLLADWPGGFVDADGDIALAAAEDVEWFIEVVDPRADDAAPLATLRFAGNAGWRRTVGVATSGTSVHRWQFADGREAHHLIDPRTGLPARTDVIQATVVAPTAREAEVLAKAAVILGHGPALAYLARSAALAALLLLESGALQLTPGSDSWLA